MAAIRKVRAAEKIILPGDRDRLGCVTQIRVRAACQRDEFSLCTSKFESDMPSHAVSLRSLCVLYMWTMEYRGIDYAVRARPGRNEWLWTISPKQGRAIA